MEKFPQIVYTVRSDEGKVELNVIPKNTSENKLRIIY